jgi:hypothetical protein
MWDGGSITKDKRLSRILFAGILALFILALQRKQKSFKLALQKYIRR